MNIILTGILSTLLVLAVSAGLISAITVSKNTEFFLNWAGMFFMAATPFQIMMAVVWKHQFPSFLANLAQPVKGIILTMMFFIAGAVITPILIYTVGQGSITPILIHYTIQSVGLSLLVILVFGCWPICKISNHPLLLGFGTLLYCYLLNYLLFIVFYDYSFMVGAPFYTEALNPEGLFNGIEAMSFAVTAVAFVMVLAMFEMWPVTQIVKNGSQPLFGLVGTTIIITLAGLTYYLFVNVIGMEPMDFMVQVPVCIIFGAFLVDNMMQFQLLSHLAQPVRGVVKLFLCTLGALLMYRLYEWSLPVIVGDTLPSGPTAGYLKEAWIGTAMLGITFPVINFVSGAFEFWPIKRKG